MTITDRRGVPTSASDQSEIDAFDDGFDLFLDYELSAGGAMKQVVADHPGSVLATVLRGYMMMMLEASALHPKVAATARSLADDAAHANDRERGHIEALAAWASGDVFAAAHHWDRLLARHPHDLLALKLHHYTTFWTGRASVLLSAVDGVFDAWDETIPGYDHVLGMRAFALNEIGRYEEAESVGRQAVERNDEDLWSVHAVAHALEMRGDLASGDALFDVAPDRWATKNPFVGHLWWHAALFAWNGGDYDRVLALYDDRLRPASTEFFLDLQNLSSLLMRLELAGVDVGDRWVELGDHAAARVGDHVLTFTDVHAAMTLARTQRTDDLDAFAASLAAHRDTAVDRYRSGAAAGEGATTGTLGAAPTGGAARHLAGLDAAVELTRGFCHLADGDAAAAVEAMAAVRGELAPIGGSHAQRDLFDLILIDAAGASGDGELALDLLRARSRRWPNSVPTLHRYAQALAGAGLDDEADRATRRAMEMIGS